MTRITFLSFCRHLLEACNHALLSGAKKNARRCLNVLLYQFEHDELDRLKKRAVRSPTEDAVAGGFSSVPG